MKKIKTLQDTGTGLIGRLRRLEEALTEKLSRFP